MRSIGMNRSHLITKQARNFIAAENRGKRLSGVLLTKTRLSRQGRAGPFAGDSADCRLYLVLSTGCRSVQAPDVGTVFRFVPHSAEALHISLQTVLFICPARHSEDVP